MKNILKSIGAVVAGFILVFVLTPITDIAVQKVGFMTLTPVDANPRRVFVVVILYRCIYYVAGGYLVARLAPHKPMRHVIILGVILSILLAIGTVAYWGVGPGWYPIAVTLTAIPGTLLGYWLRTRK